MRKMDRFLNMSIQVKLILAFMLTSVLITLVDGVLYYNINLSVSKVNEVYKSNVSMNEFEDVLSKVDSSLHEFLETKSSLAIDQYYRNSQRVEQYLRHMEESPTDQDTTLMLEDICNLTRHYLEVTAQAVTAKRGRNIEKYRTSYDQAKTELKYINTFIYSLNNEQLEVNSKNYEVLVKTLHYLEVVCGIMLAAVSIINLILIYMLTKQITKPLIMLAKAADQVGDGTVIVPFIEVESKDEVGTVAHAFNQMTLRLQEYITRIRESIEKETAHKEKELLMENHLKDVRLKYLQAQINPHFLFNTLNAGAQLAMMEGADQTCMFIEHMADFFRYNIKKIERDTTIAQELTLVDHYLYIMNVRFSGEIHYECDIDEQVLSFQVPSMILQPIIENAVNHGIRDMEGEGRIRLKIYKEGNDVCISIKDNGVGMSREQIAKLLSLEENMPETKQSNGIGLINVMKRLNMYYHEKNAIEIKSDGSHTGTEIILYLPILQ